MFSSAQSRGAVLLLLAATALSACATGNYSTTHVDFNSSGDRLRGTLALPRDGGGPWPVMLFVAGDGPSRADAYGYYDSIWTALAARGIASFSWDKPGVGESQGDWLTQDMDDRAAEVVAAFRRLSEHEQVSKDRVGIIGFSQAGWVLPRLAGEQWLDYLVFVSPAVNWLQQGKYFTRKRLELAGQTELTDATIAQERPFDELLLSEDATYDDYLRLVERVSEDGERIEPMSKARFGFARINMREDATRFLADIDVPVLALFGEDDLNVDVDDSINVYSRVLADKTGTDFRYRVFPESTHALTKSEYFNRQIPGLLYVLKINLHGAGIFAEGVLDEIGDFAEANSKR